MSLNDITEKDSYTILDMRTMIQATAGSNFLTVLNLKDGYYQVEIEESHKHKTAFEINNKYMSGMEW